MFLKEVICLEESKASRSAIYYRQGGLAFFVSQISRKKRRTLG